MDQGEYNIKTGEKNQQKGVVSMLGENVISLAPLSTELIGLKNHQVKQKLEFYRDQGETKVIVGKLNVAFKLIVKFN